MASNPDTLKARRLQGFAAQLAASGTEKSAAEKLIKSYSKKAAVRDRKHETIRKTILSGLAAG